MTGGEGDIGQDDAGRLGDGAESHSREDQGGSDALQQEVLEIHGGSKIAGH